MSKTILAVGAIILIGVGVYVVVGPGMSGGGPNATSTPQQTSSNASLSSLVAAGQPVSCNYATTTVDGTHTEGTIYVAGGMVAAELASQTAAGNIQTHMIVRDNTSYLWTNLSTQGFKSTVTGAQVSSQNGGIDYNAPADYSCQPWTPDNSKFTVPTNISFLSMADVGAPPMGAGAGASTGTKGNAQQCAACNSLTGSQKTQCLAALQC